MIPGAHWLGELHHMPLPFVPCCGTKVSLPTNYDNDVVSFIILCLCFVGEEMDETAWERGMCQCYHNIMCQTCVFVLV